MDYPELQERVRSVTRHVPFRAGATLLNAVLSTFARSGRRPNWRVSDGVADYPAMELDVSSPFQRRLFYFPRAYWEWLMRLPFGRFLSSTLQEGQVFLDIGAGLGFYSLFAARRVGPTGRVYSFETDPLKYESLLRSMRRNGFRWSRCINAALSDREGTIPISAVSDATAHSLVPEADRRAKRHTPQVPVRVTRVDDLDREGVFDTPTIDLVKIDVEGEEPHTVTGMLKTLERFQFPMVWTEVHGPQDRARAANTYPRVERELRNLGYTPLQWRNGALREVKTHDIRGKEDVLFRYG